MLADVLQNLVAGFVFVTPLTLIRLEDISSNFRQPGPLFWREL